MTEPGGPSGGRDSITPDFPATDTKSDTPDIDGHRPNGLVPLDDTSRRESIALEVEEGSKQFTKASFWDIFRSFSLLGWTAFGGPAAHIALFNNTFVDRLKWMSDAVFVELLALSQCLPGPASTQLSFALGVTQKGVFGGLLSGMLFQYPGLLIMGAAGFGAAEWLVDPAAWLRGVSAGLSAVAVALVAESAVALGSKVCVDRVTTVLCAGAAGVTFYYQTQWLFPSLMLVGGLATLYSKRNDDVRPKATDGDVEHLGLTLSGGIAVLALWLVVLVGVIVGVRYVDYKDARFLHWFKAFYVTGSVIYGGGQVVLPLIQTQVVFTDTVCTTLARNASSSATEPQRSCRQVDRADTWVTTEQFLSGLALAQAMPGPLFNFAAYLGAVIGGFPGIVACWVGLFGPGVLLIFGVLPFWGRFRKWLFYRRMLPGLNATAVGLIWASVFTLGLQAYKISPFPQASTVIGIWGFAICTFLKVPAPLAIVGGGVLGLVAHYTKCN